MMEVSIVQYRLCRYTQPSHTECVGSVRLWNIITREK